MNQSLINAYSLKENLMIICGHYKGIDQRIRDLHVTKELSLGDFVISGGELAAAVFTDAIVRIIPKAIGNEESALTDSFQDELLAPPIYTRPASYKGMEVPEVLLSGNHANIQDWLIQKSEERTKHLRPDLNKNQ
jgi:tRNA (guanine37-N1)-methyltransferase